jgi:acetyl esterase/lipase
MRTHTVIAGMVALIVVVATACTTGADSTAPPIDTAAPVDAAAPVDTASPVATGVSVVQDIPYYADGPQLDAYLPDPRPATATPAVILVHGGGWSQGSKVDWQPWATKLVDEQGWAAFSIDYRLDDTDPMAWPDEVLDVQAAIRFVAANANVFGIDPNQMVLIGESAGGNLGALVSSLGTTTSFGTSPAGAASAGQQVNGVAVAGQPLAIPAGDVSVSLAAVALWSAPTELAALEPPAPGEPAPGCGTNEACAFIWDSNVMEAYLRCSASQCPGKYADASPITHVSPATVPTFVANAKEELVPLAQATDYAAALASAGVAHELKVVDGTAHALQNADAVWSDTIRFLTRYLTSPMR